MNNDLIKFDDTEYGIAYKTAEIDFPEYEKLKKNVDTLCDEFKQYEVTTDNISNAKTVRAKLNKFAKAINSRKIAIVKEADKPVNDFKSKIKVLVTESKEASDHINQQIKVFEEKAKEQRHEYNVKRIMKMCEEAGVDSADVLEVENGYNPKWDNQSFSNIQFENEVNQKIAQAKQLEEQNRANQKLVAQEADRLGLPADHWLEVLANGTTIDQVISKMTNYKKELEEIAEREEAAKKKQAEEDAKLVKKQGKAVDPETGEIKAKIYTIKLEISATMPQLEQLAKFCKDWNISAKRVK